MKYCKKCVQPDTRPGIMFDEEGVCLPCRYFEALEYVDWDARRSELDEVIEFGRKNNVSGYDCIIGVSGGKDSTRQAMLVKQELGLKPLLVCCSYPPEQLTERGAHNISNLISLGFDCITVAPDPKVWKTLFRQGFFYYGNFFKASEMALYACLPKAAIAYHIPLIFLGENPTLLYGDCGAGEDGGDGNKMKYSNTLDGGDPKNLMTDKMTHRDTYWYRYPSDDEIRRAKLRIVYLGYYFKDFVSFKNAEFSIEHGLMVREDEPEEIGSYFKFDALDDDFVIVNQTIKYLKFGFGKMTDLANDAIHIGIMTRSEAIELVKRYDGRCGQKYIRSVCEYMNITKEEFWTIVEKYINEKLFKKCDDGNYVLKELIY